MTAAPYERSIIDSVLVNDGCFPSLASQLTERDFTDPIRRTIWRAFGRIAARGAAIDSIALRLELAASGELGKVDEQALIVSTLPDPDALDDYVAKVRGATRARDFRDAILDALAGTRDGFTEDRMHALAKRLGDIVAESSGAGDFVHIRDALPAYVADLDVARREKRSRGVPYGLATLDSLTDGMMPGELVIVAARPGDGKTSLALTIVEAVSSTGLVVPFFSLEMPTREVLGRLLSARAEVNGRSFRNPRSLDDIGFERIRRASGGLLQNDVVIRDARASVRDIEATCRRLRRNGPLGCVVVDYLDLIDTPADERRRERHDLEIGAKTAALKKLGKELGCPIVLLAQLGREVEKQDRAPTKADLRNSGAIEQDADTVVLLYRARAKDGDAPSDEVQIIVAKQRGGQTGKVRARFRAEFTRFEDPAERSMPGLVDPHFSEPRRGGEYL